MLESSLINVLLRDCEFGAALPARLPARETLVFVWTNLYQNFTKKIQDQIFHVMFPIGLVILGVPPKFSAHGILQIAPLTEGRKGLRAICAGDAKCYHGARHFWANGLVGSYCLTQRRYI